VTIQKKRLIGQLLQKPRDLLVTVFMMNTLVNILLQNVSSDMFGDVASWGLKVGVPLVLTLVFGEVIPKNIGLQNNLWLSYYVAPSINFFQKILSPIRRMIIYITNPLSRAMFFYLKKAEKISREELTHTLETSKKYGVLNPDEADLVGGYLDLQEATVKEAMWPRDNIIFFDINKPLSDLVYLFKEQECSTIPVCDDIIDNVKGIITAKQFFLNSDNMNSAQDLLPYLSKPFFVPETTDAKLLLRRFSENKQNFALVVDEYGSISGVITSEDIAELVVGKITDLRDKEVFYTRPGKNELIASGRLELLDFDDLFDVDLLNPNNMVTIGGWLMDRLGEVPKSGAVYETDEFFFHILSADPKRIRRVYVRHKTGDK